MPFLDYFKRFLSGFSGVLKSPEAQVLETVLKASPQAQIAIVAVEAADSVINKPKSPATGLSDKTATSPLPHG